MHCIRCGVDNPEDARFCGQCGAPMPDAGLRAGTGVSRQITCPSCGEGNDPDNRACRTCGVQLHRDEVVTLDAPVVFEPAPSGASIPPRLFGDLVSETLRLYRRHLHLLLAISIVPQLPGLLGLAELTLWQVGLLSTVGLVLQAIAQGAVVHLVASICAGSSTTVDASYRRALRSAPSLVADQAVFTLLLAASALLALFLVGIPLFFLFLVLLIFFPQAIMVEGFPFLDAFRRSARLVRGHWWRVFGISLAFILVYLTPSVLLVFLASPKVATVLLMVVGTLGMPWMMIGTTLLYFDLRVRKEGFNLEALSLELGRGRPG